MRGRIRPKWVVESVRNTQSISETLKTVARPLHFGELKDVSQRLNLLLSSFFNGKEHHLQVVLGRVGTGKTTFLSHFFRVEQRSLNDEHFILHLNFHDITSDTNIEDFFEERLWGLISQHPLFKEATTYEALQRIYQNEIEDMERGPLSFYKTSNVEKYQSFISDFLMSRYEKRLEFAERVANYVRKKQRTRVVIIFDNVDQLPQPLQEKVILFANAQTRRFGAFGIISMWEETYYAAKTGGRSLATINTAPIEMVRQGIGPILAKRLEFVVRLVESDSELTLDLDEAQCSRDDLVNYLRLMLRSLTVENRQVRAFLEFIALGNIRRALELFVHFMCAGSLDSGKILRLMKSNEAYLVPVHEFIKSIMLGSRKYFAEQSSHILNVYAIGDTEVPSHFTRLRILQYLYDRRHEASSFGRGYVPLNTLSKVLKGIGISQKDIDESVASLTSKGLIENELHALRGQASASATHLSATGRYYLTNLKNLFVYTDLVMHETPIFDKDAFEELHGLMESANINDRFLRCSTFLGYLYEEEQAELTNIRNFTEDEGLLRSHVTDVMSGFESDRRTITHKLKLD